MKNILLIFTLICSTQQLNARDGSFFSDITDWFWGIQHETETSKHTLTDKQNHISIINFTGNINVKTWEKNEVLLEVTKSGKDDALEETRIDVKHTKSSMTVKTLEKETGYCHVDYSLVIPKRCSITIQTEKGNITIINVTQPITANTYRGAIKITGAKTVQAETKYGNIDIEATDLKKTDKVLAFSNKGNVKLSIPENTNATLYAKTSHGKVSTEQRVLLKDVTTEISGPALAELRRDVQGVLGTCVEGSEIRLLTDSGNVRVQRA